MIKLKIKTLWQSLLSVLLLVILFSCNSADTTQVNLKADEQARDQVYDQILSDRELTYEFMNQMMRNTQSMHWMMEDSVFMQHMFTEENMNYMMQHNKHFNTQSMRDMMMRYYNDTSMRHDKMMHSGYGMSH